MKSQDRRKSVESARERANRRFFLKAALGSCALSIVGCSLFGRRSTINIYAASQAVTDASNRLTGDLDKLAVNSGKRPTVCFIGVSGEQADAVSDVARSELECGAKNYELVEKEETTSALKKSKTRANDLFIPTQRKQFVEALGKPIDYLIAGYVEPAPPKEHEDGQSAPVAPENKKAFRLTMVEVNTNKKYEYVSEI